MTTNRIVEAGHTFSALGPNLWSTLSWAIAQSIITPADTLCQLIDDQRPLAEISSPERLASKTAPLSPEPTFILKESELVMWAGKALARLKGARQNDRTGYWMCHSLQLTDEQENPTALLMELGLCLYKHSLGFSQSTVILPTHYARLQKGVFILLPLLLPTFSHTVILFDKEGKIE